MQNLTPIAPYIIPNIDRFAKIEPYNPERIMEKKLQEKEFIYSAVDPYYMYSNNMLGRKKFKTQYGNIMAISNNEKQQSISKKKDLYSIFLSDVLTNEDQSNVKSTNLIKGYIKAIFRFALYELKKEKDKNSNEYVTFKEFSEKHYEHIANISNLQWIWTIDNMDPSDIQHNKKIFRRMSKKFLEDDNLISKWIESSKIKEANKRAYIEKKSIFVKGLDKPDILTNLTILN